MEVRLMLKMPPMSLSLQVVKILEKHEPGRSGIGALSFLSGHASSVSSSSGASRLGPIPADEASAVQNYVEHMLFLLMEEEAGQGKRTKKTTCHCAALILVSCLFRTVARGSDGSYPGVCGSGGCDGEAVPVEPEETVHRGHEAGAAQDVPDASVSSQTASTAP